MTFPSPYGDYGSSLHQEIDLNREELKDCFRPLTGIMVLHSPPYQWLN